MSDEIRAYSDEEIARFRESNVRPLQDLRAAGHDPANYPAMGGALAVERWLATLDEATRTVSMMRGMRDEARSRAAAAEAALRDLVENIDAHPFRDDEPRTLNPGCLGCSMAMAKARSALSPSKPEGEASEPRDGGGR